MAAAAVLLLAAVAASPQSPASPQSAAPPPSPPPFEFRWAFMPTYNTFRAVVLHPPPAATHFSLALTSNLTSGTAPVNSTSGPLSLINNTVGLNWAVRPLHAPAEYNLTLLCLGADGRAVRTESGTFLRALRPFELDQEIGRGKSSQEYPIAPFTPMGASNFTPLGAPPIQSHRQVSIGVVGRVYSLTTTGLWSDVQITTTTPEPRDGCFCRSGELGPGYEPCDASTGLPLRRQCPGPTHLLKKPMELVLTDAQGVQHVAAGQDENATFVSKHSNVMVEVESRWQAGPLSGTTHATYDYDGCAKVRLTLDPCKKAKVNSCPLAV